MSIWETIFLLAGAAIIVWYIFYRLRNYPQAFSRENLSKSVSVVGIMTLLIVIIIAFCVLMLKS